MSIDHGSSFPPSDTRLAPLRPEIAIYKAPPLRGGVPSWTLCDPRVNRFFRLGWLEYKIIRCWHIGETGKVVAAVRRDTGLDCSVERVLNMADFLAGYGLLVLPPKSAVSLAIGQKRKMRQHWAVWLAKNYLFVRIPLARPDPFLRRTLPLVRWMLGLGYAMLSAAVCVLGLVLVSRQFEAFINTFNYFFSWQGALIYALALTSAKVIHEFAHAYVAVKHGSRVSSMGIALLVLWPVLYTDTTESWKLKENGKRLQIAAAGVVSEIFLAGMALVAWNFAPEGIFRSTAFVLATTTIVLTLLINGNPMMRFDGYYFLSDLLNLPNLNQRSMAMTKWQLRRSLFGWDDPPPEPLARGIRRFLIIFGCCTMIYRFFLFLGIAILVYNLFFKALGIILFVIEILYFIAMPIYNEIKVWFMRRKEAKFNLNTFFTMLAFLLATLAFITPWRVSITETAILVPERQAIVVAPHDGVIKSIMIEPSDILEKGQPLFNIVSPELSHSIKINRLQESSLLWRLERVVDDAELLSQRIVDQQRLVQIRAKLRGQTDEYNRLRIIAPFSGQIVEVNPEIREGGAIPKNTSLAVIVDWDRPSVDTYVREKDLGRFAVGGSAVFFPDDIDLSPVPAVIETIAVASQKVLDNPFVASQFGGTHATRVNVDGQVNAVEALYKTRLQPVVPLPPDWPKRFVRGTIQIKAVATSPAHRLWTRIQSAFVKETAF